MECPRHVHNRARSTGRDNHRQGLFGGLARAASSPHLQWVAMKNYQKSNVNNRRTDDEPMPVLHQSMSHVAELGSLAAAFAIKPGIRVRGRGMRLVTALLVVEMPLAVAPWRGWLV